MITIEKIKGLNGFRYTLTDDYHKEVWAGSVMEPGKDNLKETIDNFIRDRKHQIKSLNEQVEEAEKL